MARYKDGFTATARTIAAKSQDSLYSNPVAHKLRQKQIDSNLTDAFEQYHEDIVSYAHDLMEIQLWQKQLEICEALINHRLVCVRSAHSTGKSYLLGILINFFFDTLYPLVGIGTAPTNKLITQVMFAYARQFRGLNTEVLKDYWRGTAAPLLQSAEEHYFTGLTSSTPDALQGRHGPNVVIIVDEAVGVPSEMFEALESLMVGDNVYVLCIYNPTDPGSYVSKLENSPGWHTVTMSAYDHPNIWTGVERLGEGRSTTEDLPYPGAINLSRFEQLLKQWSTQIDEQQYNESRDILLPSSILKDELEYFRPGPIAEARLLGRWPNISFNTIFSEGEVDNSFTNIIKDGPDDFLTIGVDVARFGSDFSAFCVRFGNKILYMNEINGLSTTEVTEYTIQLVRKYAVQYEVSAFEVDIAVDGIGIGAGVVDQLRDYGYNVHDINVSERAFNSDEYANLRSELWFEVHKLFNDRKVSLARISKEHKFNLKKQLLAPRYVYEQRGRRKIETKATTKKRIERSPDIADALMLAFAVNTDFSNGLTYTT
jgi:hypothetical protein